MSAARRYYLFFAFIHIGMGSTMTAYTPFLQSIGLTLGEIALVNAIFWAVVIAAELPTGMLADGRSRAYSLKLGALFHAIASLAYLFAHDFWSAALGEALTAIGIAFISGAGTAWIADALHREGRPQDLRHVYATEHLIKSVLMLLGGFVGSAIALVDDSFIWLPFVFTGLGAAYLAHTHMNGQGEPLEYVSELEAFRRALARLRESRALIWVVAALIVFGAVVSFNHYWALYFLPQVGQLGLAFIWPVMYLGLMAASQLIRRLTIPVGSESHLIVMSVRLISGAAGMTTVRGGSYGVR